VGTKRRILFIALFLVVFGMFTWLVFGLRHPAEPVYQGKPLSCWVQPYDPHSRNAATSNRTYQGPPSVETVEALRQMGTNAFPKLLEMLREHDSALKLKLMALIQKQHVVRINFIPADRRNRTASGALQILSMLGTDLHPIVPDLIAIYKQARSPVSASCAADALAYAGSGAEAAIPALLQGLTNSNVMIQTGSLMALSQIRRNQPEWVKSQLTNAMKNSTPMIQFTAGSLLARVNRPGGLSYADKPLFTDQKNRDVEIRTIILSLAYQANPDESRWMGPEVAKLLNDPVPAIRQMACFALPRIYLDNPPAPDPGIISALVETLKDPDSLVRSSAARVLKQLDPGAAAKAGVK
jgi:HEAT repeat protein